MTGTVWVHDTVETGSAGLAAVAQSAGHHATHLPDLGDDQAECDGRGCPAVAAVLVIRTDLDRQLLAKIRARHPRLPVLALPLDAEFSECTSLVVQGASGAVPWESSASRLRAALEAVIVGWTVLPAGAQLIDGETSERLTVREIGWLRLLANDATVEDLAEAACVAPRTMYRYLHDLYRKVGATSRHTALDAAHRRYII